MWNSDSEVLGMSKGMVCPGMSISKGMVCPGSTGMDVLAELVVDILNMSRVKVIAENIKIFFI